MVNKLLAVSIVCLLLVGGIIFQFLYFPKEVVKEVQVVKYVDRPIEVIKYVDRPVNHTVYKYVSQCSTKKSDPSPADIAWENKKADMRADGKKIYSSKASICAITHNYSNPELC